MSAQAQPVGGRIVTKPFSVLAALFGVGAVLILFRLVLGLGRITAMNDGYPWGLWIAFDVVTGTALACGGYSVALLVYIRNKGKYHPLVRPAVLTSALGYTLAGLGVALDIGRWWNIWRVPVFFWHWNLELGAARSRAVHHGLHGGAVDRAVAGVSREGRADQLARAEALRRPDEADRRKGAAVDPRARHPAADDAPVVAGRADADCRAARCTRCGTPAGCRCCSCCRASAWATPRSSSRRCCRRGCSRREPEREMLVGHRRRRSCRSAVAYVWLRIYDLAIRGQLAALFAFDLLQRARRWWSSGWSSPRRSSCSARRAGAGSATCSAPRCCSCSPAALYRFDTYLVAFRPGAHWSYFPSVAELLITLGLVAGEIMLYIAIVKVFPILTLEKRHVAYHH